MAGPIPPGFGILHTSPQALRAPSAPARPSPRRVMAERSITPSPSPHHKAATRPASIGLREGEVGLFKKRKNEERTERIERMS